MIIMDVNWIFRCRRTGISVNSRVEKRPLSGLSYIDREALSPHQKRNHEDEEVIQIFYLLILSFLSEIGYTTINLIQINL